MNKSINADTPISFPSTTAKRPHYDVNGSQTNKSFDRYAIYSKANSTTEFFTLHPGPTDVARRDFHNDVKHGIITFTDPAYANMLFFFQPDASISPISEVCNVGISSFVDSFNECMLADAPNLLEPISIPITTIAERVTCYAFLANACSSTYNSYISFCEYID